MNEGMKILFWGMAYDVGWVHLLGVFTNIRFWKQRLGIMRLMLAGGEMMEMLGKVTGTGEGYFNAVAQ